LSEGAKCLQMSHASRCRCPNRNFPPAERTSGSFVVTHQRSHAELHGHSKHENDNDNDNDNEEYQRIALTNANHDSSV